ncbi:MAG: (d)CMP kinase [Bacteroidota bacterium]
MKNITIAIDGFAGCGKSTTARAVAQKLGYLYLDTGAMYRTVTLFFLRHQIPYDELNSQMEAAIEQIELAFFYEADKPGMRVRLNGEDVSEIIRSPKVSDQVSQVARHAIVRKAMVKEQKRLGSQGGVVVDGRDIGTVVFPEAELKVFMTASLEARAARRMEEMAAKGFETNLEKIIQNLAERDRIDSTRKVSPLKQAVDAIVLDTTHHSIDSQIEQVCQWAKMRMENHLVPLP